MYTFVFSYCAIPYSDQHPKITKAQTYAMTGSNPSFPQYGTITNTKNIEQTPQNHLIFNGFLIEPSTIRK